MFPLPDTKQKKEKKMEKWKNKDWLFQIHIIIGLGIISHLYLVHLAFQKVLS